MSNKYLTKIAQDLYMDPEKSFKVYNEGQRKSLVNHFASQGHTLRFEKSPGLKTPSTIKNPV